MKTTLTRFPIVIRVELVEDEDGELVEETTHRCPNCEATVRPQGPFCLRCGTALLPAR
ncbi:MAG: hypothetical protein WBA46_00185 [Thermomicrobiales bacterium]